MQAGGTTRSRAFFQRFFRTETLGGVVLLFCAAVALAREFAMGAAVLV
jgi:Na+/H+ antiporter NhaA